MLTSCLTLMSDLAGQELTTAAPDIGYWSQHTSWAPGAATWVLVTAVYTGLTQVTSLANEVTWKQLGYFNCFFGYLHLIRIRV